MCAFNRMYLDSVQFLIAYFGIEEAFSSKQERIDWQRILHHGLISHSGENMDDPAPLYIVWFHRKPAENTWSQCISTYIYIYIYIVCAYIFFSKTESPNKNWCRPRGLGKHQAVKRLHWTPWLEIPHSPWSWHQRLQECQAAWCLGCQAGTRWCLQERQDQEPLHLGGASCSLPWGSWLPWLAPLHSPRLPHTFLMWGLCLQHHNRNLAYLRAHHERERVCLSMSSSSIVHLCSWTPLSEVWEASSQRSGAAEW